MCTCFALSGVDFARAQTTPTPTPSAFAQPALTPTPATTVNPALIPTPEPSMTITNPGQTPTPAPSPSPEGSSPPPTPTPSPTPVPITANPANAQVPVGTTQSVSLNGVFGTFTAVAADPKLVDVGLDQDQRRISIAGKAPGSTSITITDMRGITAIVGVRVAFNAGTIANNLTISLTGDPASPDFVRDLIMRQVTRSTHTQPGAQVVVTSDDVPLHENLNQDMMRTIAVPVLVQGEQYFSVEGSTRVTVENVAVPRISPDILMVSDYPEKLTENGILFTADLHRDVPSRFLYFHYNPTGQPDRRIVLVAENHSNQPSMIQFISGRGGPTPNEAEVGHAATKTFLVNVIQNQGRLIEVPANSTQVIGMQALPAGSIVANILQLRVLDGADLHLSLIAQNASDDPDAALTTGTLLTSTVKHARGIYTIPEFHFAQQWNVNGEYLEIPIGQIPLPNTLAGETLAGDYGVLESFVVNVQNPLSTPQNIAIYENPRGGASTGTYLIDGVLVQSHRVPAFSRYKVRQYVVPAKGFVRVTIVTIPEAGSSYPLRLIFAPDDGSVAPGTVNSPVY